LLGEELLHPTLISSPFGICFNERIINGQRVEHAVVYDASLVFFHSYSNPPSIWNGNAYITFIQRPTTTEGEALASPDPSTDAPPPPPPSAPVAEELPSAVPTLLGLASAPDHPTPWSLSPLSTGQLSTGQVPDAIGRREPHSLASADTTVNESVGSQRCDSSLSFILATEHIRAYRIPFDGSVAIDDLPAHPYVCDGGDVSLSTIATNANTQPASATVLVAVAGPIPPLDSGLSNRLPKQVYRPYRSANDALRLWEPSATTPPPSSGRVGRIDGPGELLTNDTLERVVGQGKGSLVDETAFQHALDPPSTIVAQSSKHKRRMDKALGTSYVERSEGVQMEDEDS
jgi:hypothetical protein